MKPKVRLTPHFLLPAAQYLETLGYLYMMQLRHRAGFAKRACSAWRLVFVLSLMPWLHKYRDLTRPEHFGEEDDEFLTGDDTLIINPGPRNSLIINPSPHRSLTENKSNLLRSSCMLRQSMVSSRWSARALFIPDDNVKSSFDSQDADTSSVESDSREYKRILEIKQEILRLNKELSALENKLGVGIEMPELMTKPRVTLSLVPLAEQERSPSSSPQHDSQCATEKVALATHM